MLYIIPGFPFITSGIDLAKLDMRSGLERLAYAVIIVVTSTITGWVMSTALNLHPADFADLNIPPALHLILRLAASFAGVFGFSIMFNSPVPIASAAALIGAVANTLRLELVELAALPAAVAAFLGALTAGLLASFLMKRLGYPRISVTVPSIVIMVPGLYLYRGGLQYGRDVTGSVGKLACLRSAYHHDASSRTDLCPDHHGPFIQTLYLKLRAEIITSANVKKGVRRII